MGKFEQGELVTVPFGSGFGVVSDRSTSGATVWYEVVVNGAYRCAPEAAMQSIQVAPSRMLLLGCVAHTFFFDGRWSWVKHEVILLSYELPGGLYEVEVFASGERKVLHRSDIWL